VVSVARRRPTGPRFSVVGCTIARRSGSSRTCTFRTQPSVHSAGRHTKHQAQSKGPTTIGALCVRASIIFWPSVRAGTKPTRTKTTTRCSKIEPTEYLDKPIGLRQRSRRYSAQLVSRRYTAAISKPKSTALLAPSENPNCGRRWASDERPRSRSRPCCWQRYQRRRAVRPRMDRHYGVDRDQSRSIPSGRLAVERRPSMLTVQLPRTSAPCRDRQRFDGVRNVESAAMLTRRASRTRRNSTNCSVTPRV